jgi:hypothetical protein
MLYALFFYMISSYEIIQLQFYMHFFPDFIVDIFHTHNNVLFAYAWRTKDWKIYHMLIIV